MMHRGAALLISSPAPRVGVQHASGRALRRCQKSLARRAIAQPEKSGWVLEGKPEQGWHRVDGCYDNTPRHDFHTASEHVFTSTSAVASACDGLEPVTVDVDVDWCDDSGEFCHGWSPDVGPMDVPKSALHRAESP